MQVAVGEDDEAAVQGLGVLAGLLLPGQRAFGFGLGFENDQREAFLVEQQEIDESPGGLLEVIAEGVQVGGLERDAGFETDIGGGAAVREEAPAGGFEQLVDLYPGSGFLIGHSASCFLRRSWGSNDWQRIHSS